MPLHGLINNRDELIADLTIIGFRAETTVKAIVDTGFSGELWVPASIIGNLGMDLRVASFTHLADGSRIRNLTFNGKIRWMERIIPISVILSYGDEILIGTQLLRNCKCIIDYPARQFVIEE